MKVSQQANKQKNILFEWNNLSTLVFFFLREMEISILFLYVDKSMTFLAHFNGIK